MTRRPPSHRRGHPAPGPTASQPAATPPGGPDGGAALDAGHTSPTRLRLAMCAMCPQHIRGYTKVLNRCGICHCFTEAKARVTSQTCPLNYWPI